MTASRADAGPDAPPKDPPDPLELERTALRGLLLERIAQGAGASWETGAFEELALRIFRYQARANPPYGALVEARGIDPEELDDWTAIPPVPVRAFQEVDLACQAPTPPAAVFRTSGTTSGGRKQGAHPVRDLEIYRRSALAAASWFLLPGSEDSQLPAGTSAPGGPVRVLSLTPDPMDRPDSSLCRMIGFLREAWDDGGGGHVAGPEWELDLDRLRSGLRAAVTDQVPVLLAGTAFSFVHWLDRDPEPLERLRLPSGSLVLETGGFKGRSREVPRRSLYRAIEDRTGIPEARMVNEYGMTELLSQFYETVLREAGSGPLEERSHRAPPWLRTRILDPVSLAPVAPGEIGMLCHFDIANLDSIMPVLTEDLGRIGPGGLRLVGRRRGALPRGCSLAMEDLLTGGDRG